MLFWFLGLFSGLLGVGQGSHCTILTIIYLLNFFSVSFPVMKMDVYVWTLLYMFFDKCFDCNPFVGVAS
jgi:hypothetical protein